MKIVSLILARGGSKGIPGKNIIDLNGIKKLQLKSTRVAETGMCGDHKL